MFHLAHGVQLSDSLVDILATVDDQAEQLLHLRLHGDHPEPDVGVMIWSTISTDHLWSTVFHSYNIFSSSSMIKGIHSYDPKYHTMNNSSS